MRGIVKTSHLLLAFVLLCASSVAQAQTPTNSSWNVTISPSAGGTKTAISFFATGGWTNGYTGNRGTNAVILAGPTIGVSGALGSPSNAWTIASGTTFTFPSFGYVTNVTSGSSSLLTDLRFNSPGGSFLTMDLFLESGLTINPNDTAKYVFDATPTVLEIDLAFDNFNPGTYNALDSSTGNEYNMEIVPEPSTYALLALSVAGLSGYVLRRRRK